MKLFKKAFLKAMTGLLLIGILVGCEDLITAGSITVITPDSTAESITEALTETTTEDVAKPDTEDVTEKITEATGESTTEPVTESITTVPATEPETKPPHIHKFKAATCTEAKTCACGATDGMPAGHIYVNGKCIACGISDPNYVSEAMVWIPTKGGTKYHTHSDCSNMDVPDYVTKSYAESLGFTPCKRCH